jgi:hypothetical protein
MTVGKYEYMTKGAKTSTREQLRSLISRHVENAAATAPQPILSTTIAAPVQVPKAPEASTVVPVCIESRQSLRLIPSELSQINVIINRTLAQTGERATVTDVLRVGLKRLGETAQITAEEIKSLRASDRRRNKTKGQNL